MSVYFVHFIYFAVLARQVKWLLMSKSSASPARIILFNGVWIVGKMCKADLWDLSRASLGDYSEQSTLWLVWRDMWPAMFKVRCRCSFLILFFNVMGLSDWKAASDTSQIHDINYLSLKKKDKFTVFNVCSKPIIRCPGFACWQNSQPSFCVKVYAIIYLDKVNIRLQPSE